MLFLSKSSITHCYSMMQMRHWWWLIAMNVIDFLGLRLVLDGSLHEDLGCWVHIIFTLTRQLEWPTLISTTLTGKFTLVTLCTPIIIDICFFFRCWYAWSRSNMLQKMPAALQSRRLRHIALLLKKHRSLSTSFLPPICCFFDDMVIKISPLLTFLTNPTQGTLPSVANVGGIVP